MTTAQHTPGPWQCATQGHSWLVTRTPIGEWIAEINREMPEGEAAANAHLIAAAPALLAAAKEIIAWYRKGADWKELTAIEMTEDAITQAEPSS